MRNNKMQTIISLILLMVTIALLGGSKESKIIKEESKYIGSSNNAKNLNEKNKTREDDKSLETGRRIEIQGISVIYPSGWGKKNINGRDVYLLDDKGTNVNLVVESMKGLSEEEYNKASDIDVKTNLGIDNIKVQEYEFNNKKARITYFIQKSQGKEMPTCQVTFLNNNISYIFTIASIGKISEENLKEFGNLLNTIEYVKY